MADPISVAGTAVGIISLGIQLCQGISEYYTAWKDHNEHVQRTCEAVDTLCQQLKTLDNALQNDVFARDIMIDVHASIVRCEDGVIKLREKLKKIKKLEGSAFRDKVENQVRHYLGPFRESTLAKFREIVHELRGRLQFAMDTLHL